MKDLQDHCYGSRGENRAGRGGSDTDRSDQVSLIKKIVESRVGVGSNFGSNIIKFFWVSSHFGSGFDFISSDHLGSSWVEFQVI
jgi:hypothetical protein